MLKRAREVIASGDEKAIVDYAIEANRTVKKASAELDEAKGYLRKVALGRSGQAQVVELEGNLGVATVSLSGSEAKFRKGKDHKDIEVNLSADVFQRLFEKKVVILPVENFEEELEKLSPAEKAIVDRFVEVLPSTPKVHLTR